MHGNTTSGFMSFTIKGSVKLQNLSDVLNYTRYQSQIKINFIFLKMLHMNWSCKPLHNPLNSLWIVSAIYSRVKYPWFHGNFFYIFSKFHGKWKFWNTEVIYDKKDCFSFFGANLVQKNKIACLIWNLVPTLIGILLKPMVMLTFAVFDWKYLFEQIWSEKSKLCLRRNLVPRQIRRRWIWWRCLFFMFLSGSPFLGKFGPKNQHCLLKLVSAIFYQIFIF